MKWFDRFLQLLNSDEVFWPLLVIIAAAWLLYLL